jgi:hypothetical protein
MRFILMRSAVLALSMAVAFSSGGIASTPNTIEDASRSAPGGRAVEVLVAQSEIKSDINPSNLAVATGGGLLGGLLAASQNAARAKKAEATIGPIRTALSGFDAEALALETTKQAVSETAWLQPTAITFSKDSSVLGKSAFIDSSGAAQVAFIEYSYDLSPDFSSVRVVATLQFANKALPAGDVGKPETRLSPGKLAYAQSITSIVTMPGASKDAAANAALWSANDGKAAKAALALAFAQVHKLLPRTLALSAADIKAMNGKDKHKDFAGGFFGRVQETSPSETLLWANGFIDAQTLPQAG